MSWQEVHEGAVPHASQAICCTELFAAVFAEFDAVILRKANVVVQLGRATGEPRHIRCEWVVNLELKAAFISRSGIKD